MIYFNCRLLIQFGFFNNSFGFLNLNNNQIHQVLDRNDSQFYNKPSFSKIRQEEGTSRILSPLRSLLFCLFLMSRSFANEYFFDRYCICRFIIWLKDTEHFDQTQLHIRIIIFNIICSKYIMEVLIYPFTIFLPTNVSSLELTVQLG